MKRFISVLTLLCTLFVIFSCSSGKTEVSDTSAGNTSSDVSAQTSSDEEIVYKANVPVVDMGNREFRVLCRDYGFNSNSVIGYNGEVIQRPEYSEATAGVVDFNKAEARRRIEERFNCRITGTFNGGSQSEFNTIVRNGKLTGSDQYDMVFDSYNFAAPLVLEGMYMDLNKIPGLDFSQPWWDQNAKNDLSIDHKLYFMLGDINTFDNDGTWVMLFNKDLKERMKIEDDLYTMARERKWTFDDLVRISKKVTFDSDGDGDLDEFDTWGFGTETYNVYIHAVAAGEKIVRKNENDIPEFTFNDKSVYKSMEKIVDFYSDLNTVMVANNGRFDSKNYPNVWESTIIKAFTDGRELFFCCGLMNVPGFRNMEDEFGILPVPLMDAEQTEYYHSVSMHNMSCLLVPVSVKAESDEDYTHLGYVIESLAAESKNIVTPAYYVKSLKYQQLFDDESGEMLDIIFATRSFDLGTVFGWGNVISQFMTIDPNFASRFESILPSAEQDLQRTIDTLRGLS